MYAQDNISASLDYFVTTSPPYLYQFSTISGGNCINNRDNDYTIEHSSKEKLEHIGQLPDVMDMVEDVAQLFNTNASTNDTQVMKLMMNKHKQIHKTK